ATAEGLDRSLDVTLSARAMLARRLLRALRAEAEQAEITGDELSAATARRWLDVDRPEGFRTVHAVVRFDSKAPEDKRRAALDLAARIRAAALPLADKDTELRASPAEEDPLVSAFQRAIAP